MKILILGASGMLGNAVLRKLRESQELEVYGTLRSESSRKFFPANIVKYLISGINVQNGDSLLKLFERIRPTVVVNCIGIIKQSSDSDNPLEAIPINSILPHRLAYISSLVGARLIHISTDCVFSGKKRILKTLYMVPNKIVKKLNSIYNLSMNNKF